MINPDDGSGRITRNTSTPAGKKFWAAVEKGARGVPGGPDYALYSPTELLELLDDDTIVMYCLSLEQYRAALKRIVIRRWQESAKAWKIDISEYVPSVE